MGSKREARIARKLAKEFEQKEKSARFAASVAAEIQDRVARTGANPGSIYQMLMVWDCTRADRAEAWSWGLARDWGADAWNGVIHPKLSDFEKMLWREIEAATTDSGHHMHHSMPRDTIVAEAQQRLDYLESVEEDIYRFRLGNRRRLWGFRTVNVFELLWYDPEHHIYPTDPD
jgi:hypothetical protein